MATCQKTAVMIARRPPPAACRRQAASCWKDGLCRFREIAPAFKA